MSYIWILSCSSAPSRFPNINFISISSRELYFTIFRSIMVSICTSSEQHSLTPVLLGRVPEVGTSNLRLNTGYPDWGDIPQCLNTNSGVVATNSFQILSNLSFICHPIIRPYIGVWETSYINQNETQEPLEPWTSSDPRTHEDSSLNWGAGMPGTNSIISLTAQKHINNW
jgi:hypothetical protein